MRPTVYLFDIDGTLLDGGGSGRRAMEGGFADVTGDDQALRGVAFAGMTDPAIVRMGLARAGRDEQDDEVVAAVIERYLARLPEAIATSDMFRLHTGVRETLDALRNEDAIAIGLGTGNVERGARVKLTPLGIADRFGFGGFASDAGERAALIGIGAARGCARLGLSRSDVRVVIIGDTPLDVAAALANEAECLAVATGWYTADALASAGATRAVADLATDEALEFLLRG